MQGWNSVENTFGIRWPFWNRHSLQALHEAIAGANLVWIHDTLYPGAHAAFRIARAMGRPVLATQHQSPSFYGAQRNPLRGLWSRLSDRIVTSRLLRQARQVTFTSNAAARFYHRRISFPAPARIIPNGVDSHAFHPPSPDDYRNLRKRFALRDDQPVLLFVGRLERANTLSIIRHMAFLLPKWRFWLAGHGRVRPETWYLPNVQVFRDRTGGAMAELYQAADLLILPGSDSESPHILQQALACQLPIMCGPAVVSGNPGAARCLVVNTDISPERTAKHWVQKLKAGKDVWPVVSDGETPFDSSWDWQQVAAHYIEILQTICQSQFRNEARAMPRRGPKSRL
jgi:glycosyltransferase involved in cell wall biosynthesis